MPLLLRTALVNERAARRRRLVFQLHNSTAALDVSDIVFDTLTVDNSNIISLSLTAIRNGYGQGNIKYSFEEFDPHRYHMWYMDTYDGSAFKQFRIVDITWRKNEEYLSHISVADAGLDNTLTYDNACFINRDYECMPTNFPSLGHIGPDCGNNSAMVNIVDGDVVIPRPKPSKNDDSRMCEVHGGEGSVDAYKIHAFNKHNVRAAVSHYHLRCCLERQLNNHHELGDRIIQPRFSIPAISDYMYLAEISRGIYLIDMITNEEKFITTGHIVRIRDNIYIFRDHYGLASSTLCTLGGHGVILEEWMAALFRASIK
jgi:hypothetical protein